MNLAIKDIRHNFGRFAMTVVGVGLLMMIVMGMGGIYRGLVEDATLLVDRIGVDLWVVQRNTRGPFAEVSRIPASMEDRVRAVAGVASACNFVSHTIQRKIDGKPMRMVIQGLAWPQDNGHWLPLIAGRNIENAHYEMIADKSLGMELGQKIRLGKDVYTVVGITRNMASSSGDSMAFVTLQDSLAIQYDLPGEAVRLERESRRARAENADIGKTSPETLARISGETSNVPALGPKQVSAVLVKLSPGVSAESVATTISSWPDVSVYTHEKQRELLLKGNVDRSRRQLLLFRSLLVIVSTIIIALIIYTLTLDKIHDIAVLKLIGAQNHVIFGMILRQAFLIGCFGYVIAYIIGQWVFPKFPRRVVIVQGDLWILAGIVLGISILASMLGIWRAMKVQPSEVIS